MSGRRSKGDPARPHPMPRCLSQVDSILNKIEKGYLGVYLRKASLKAGSVTSGETCSSRPEVIGTCSSLRPRPARKVVTPREELLRGNAMSASHQAYRHARLKGLLDHPNLLSRCPAPTALNRRDDLNSIPRVAHRHGCMPHTC
jgi:hypothetical protein